jgi:hypothetical protein
LVADPIAAAAVENRRTKDAQWMGQLLSQLSPEQIHDAFRAAGYSPGEVEGFSKVVEGRIAQLNKLPEWRVGHQHQGE